MSDEPIGTIEGTATYEKVAVAPEGSNIRVYGEYMGDRMTYEAPVGSVYIGGLEVDLIHDEFWLTPEDEDGWVWVHSTGKELHITKEEPE